MEETPQPSPPAGYTPPPPPEAAQAPPKKSKTVWWVVGCGCVLLLCIGVVLAAVLGGSLFGIGIFSGYKAITAPVEPIKGQLAALNAGDVQKAYDEYTSNGFKKATSLEDFQRMVESNPEIFKSKDSSFTNVSIKNDTAKVSGTITGQDGTVTQMQYSLVLENGKWKIQMFEEK